MPSLSDRNVGVSINILHGVRESSRIADILASSNTRVHMSYF